MPSRGLAQFRSTFQEKLNALCRERGSIANICRRCGINRQQFNKYLSGQSLPSIYTLTTIAEALDLDVTEFFSPTGSPNRYPASPAELFAPVRAPAKPLLSRGYYLEHTAVGEDGRTMVKSVARIWADGAQLRFRRKTPLRSRIAGRSRMWTHNGFANESAHSVFIYYVNAASQENFGSYLLHRRSITSEDLIGLRLAVGSLVSDEPCSTATYFEFVGERPKLVDLMRSCGILPADQQSSRDRARLSLLAEAAETRGSLLMTIT